LNSTWSQLLSFARSNPPAGPPGSAAEIVQSVVSLFRSDAADRAVTLRSSIGPDASLDGTRTAAIRDALSNLILNALQATPRGGEVKIDWRIMDGQLVFSVADTGPGIDEDQREQIWRPFFTTRQR